MVRSHPRPAAAPQGGDTSEQDQSLVGGEGAGRCEMPSSRAGRGRQQQHPARTVRHRALHCHGHQACMPGGQSARAAAATWPRGGGRGCLPPPATMPALWQPRRVAAALSLCAALAAVRPAGAQSSGVDELYEPARVAVHAPSLFSDAGRTCYAEGDLVPLGTPVGCGAGCQYAQSVLGWSTAHEAGGVVTALALVGPPDAYPNAGDSPKVHTRRCGDLKDRAAIGKTAGGAREGSAQARPLRSARCCRERLVAPHARGRHARPPRGHIGHTPTGVRFPTPHAASRAGSAADARPPNSRVALLVLVPALGAHRSC